MSISSALNNAYSGLSAMSRSAETVSNNVSNTMTEGYSRQQVEYTSTVLGGLSGGVKVEGISRSEDILATRLRRDAATDFSNKSTLSVAMSRISDQLGSPGDAGALAVQYAAFEDSIGIAISAPDSIALQQGILQTAKTLAATFSDISNEVSLVRMDADSNIAKEVETVNQSLKQIESINLNIRKLSLSGRNTSTLEDQRQMAIDRINTIIPIRDTVAANGEVSIYSKGGVVLLNGSARLLEFTQTRLITPDMSLGSGALSALSVEGIQLDVSASGREIDGGSLAASFRIRDAVAPDFQVQLDALSVDLIERFQDVATDPTLTVGSAGIFTDSGVIFNSTNETGISGRIAVNGLVDPAMGGELWRLRDGLGASVQGAAGESSQLIRMSEALVNARPASSNMGLAVAMSGTGFVQEVTSYWASESHRAEEAVSYKRSVLSVLRTEELHATGVDTDREMQTLLIVEQAYAANARVISVLDGLMKKLLEM